MLESELAKLLEGTADAAFTVDGRGMIRTRNRAAQELFGYAPSEVLHRPCAPVFQGRDRLGASICRLPCSVIDCAAAQRPVSNYDMETKSRAGESLWVNVSILQYHDEATGRHLMVHLARDIRLRKKHEEMIEQFQRVAQRISALSQAGVEMPPVPPLSEQERRILRLLAEGKTPAKTAQELEITPVTLRNHLHHVNRKLHTRSRLEAVTQATRRGLL